MCPRERKAQFMTNMISQGSRDILDKSADEIAQLIRTELEAVGRISFSGDLGSVAYDENGQGYYWDDSSGKTLDTELVDHARREEMSYYKEFSGV